MNPQRLAGVLAGAFLLSAAHYFQSALSPLMGPFDGGTGSYYLIAAIAPLLSGAVAAFLGVSYWNDRGARWLESVTFVVLALRVFSHLVTGATPFFMRPDQLREPIRVWMIARTATDLIITCAVLGCVVALRQLNRAASPPELPPVAPQP